MSMIRAVRAASRTALMQRRTATPFILSRSIGTAAPPTPGPDNYMTGRQLEEFELQLEGVAGFNDLPACGPFGTVANPVRIYSSFHSRYAGCKGGDHNKHRVLWFELKAGPKHACSECGQVFQLVTPHGHGMQKQA